MLTEELLLKSQKKKKKKKEINKNEAEFDKCEIYHKFI